MPAAINVTVLLRLHGDRDKRTTYFPLFLSNHCVCQAKLPLSMESTTGVAGCGLEGDMQTEPATRSQTVDPDRIRQEIAAEAAALQEKIKKWSIALNEPEMSIRGHFSLQFAGEVKRSFFPLTPWRMYVKEHYSRDGKLNFCIILRIFGLSQPRTVILQTSQPMKSAWRHVR